MGRHYLPSINGNPTPWPAMVAAALGVGMEAGMIEHLKLHRMAAAYGLAPSKHKTLTDTVVGRAAQDIGPIVAYWNNKKRHWTLHQKPCQPSDIIAYAERRRGGGQVA